MPPTTCPVCNLEAIYVRSEDRYYHLDGSDNRPCWLHLVRGTRPTEDTC